MDDAFDGVIEYNLTNLPVNYYNVSVNYTGDDINPAKQIDNPLTVVKTDDYTIVVDVTPGKAGKNSTIKVTVPSDADGNLTIVVDGTPYMIPVENGVGILTIPLNAGDHVVNATLSNDTNYKNKTSDSVPFNISKDEDYSIGIKVISGSSNSNSVIVVSVPSDADGNLTVVVDGVPHLVPIDENGVGILSIPLDAGDHVANATLSNNTNYANKTSYNVPFNIPEGETYSIGVTVLPSKAGENSTIIVSVPSDADGNLTVVVDSVPYVVPVDEGIGILPVALDAGDHVVNATLSNDTSYPEKTSDSFSFNIPKVDDYTIGLDVVVGKVGEKTNITVTVPKGVNGDVVVDINGTVYPVTVGSDGIGVISVSTLLAGNYDAVAKVRNDSNYADKNSEVKPFEIEDEDYSITVNVLPGEAGEDTIIAVSVPSDADGNLTVVVDGTPYIVPIDKNGIGILPVALDAGDHVVNATLRNDTSYPEKTSESVLFNIPQIEDYSVELDVVPAKVGENTTITVTVPKGVTGDVVVDINGTVYPVTVGSDGIGVISVSTLPAGNYDAVAKVRNDSNYADKDSKVKPFEIVGENPCPISMVVIPGSCDEPTEIIVVVPSNVDGNVTVNVDGVDYPVTIDNGVGILEIPLAPGNHVASAKVSDDSKYDDSQSDSQSFNVDKEDDYTIGLDVVAGKVGENTILTVTVPKDVTGIVSVDINGTYYLVIVDSKGIGIVNISNLASGNYSAVAKVRNDVNYTDKDSNVKPFEILPNVDFDMKVSVTPGDAGDDSIIVVTVPDDIDGNLTVVVDGTPYIVPIDKNGIGILPVALDAGDHVVNATLRNDTSYPEKTSESVLFNIPQIEDYSVELDVVPAKVGENTTITVTVPKGVTGDVVVDINGTVYPVTVGSDGIGVISVSTLPAGNYDAVAKVRNDSNYADKDSKVKPFEIVGENPCPISMVVIPGSCDEPTEIIVVVPSNVDGNVTVNVDGVDYPVTIDNGVGILEIPLAPGNHVASAKVSDDSKYDDSQSDSQSFNVDKEDDYTIGLDVVAGKVGENTILTVTVPKDVIGSVIIDINGTSYPVDINSDGVGVLKVSLAPGNYSAVAKVRNDIKYANKDSTVKPFEILPISDYDIKVDVTSGLAGENTIISVNVPKDVDGNVTANVDGVDYPVTIDKDGNGVIKFPLDVGEHKVKVTLANDTKYADKSVDTTFTVKTKTSTINATDMKRGYNSPYDYKATFTDANGNILKNTVVRFVVNGVSYYNATDENGVAYLSVALPVVNYATTDYAVEIYNLVTGEHKTAITSIVPRIIGVYNITDDYLGGISYIAQAIGDDGEPVGAGEIIPIVFEFKTYYVVTNETGHFVRTIGLTPGYYTVYSTYKGYKSEQTFVSVKQIISTKKITVKKSAKSFNLYTTLKWSNGTPLVSKTVTFIFKGNEYVAVTNSNGIATYTIKSSVIKKLTAGKSYKYRVKYVDDLTEGEVKVTK